MVTRTHYYTRIYPILFNSAFTHLPPAVYCISLLGYRRSHSWIATYIPGWTCLVGSRFCRTQRLYTVTVRRCRSRFDAHCRASYYRLFHAPLPCIRVRFCRLPHSPHARTLHTHAAAYPTPATFPGCCTATFYPLLSPPFIPFRTPPYHVYAVSFLGRVAFVTPVRLPHPMHYYGTYVLLGSTHPVGTLPTAIPPDYLYCGSHTACPFQTTPLLHCVLCRLPHARTLRLPHYIAVAQQFVDHPQLPHTTARIARMLHYLFSGLPRFPRSTPHIRVWVTRLARSSIACCAVLYTSCNILYTHIYLHCSLCLLLHAPTPTVGVRLLHYPQITLLVYYTALYPLAFCYPYFGYTTTHYVTLCPHYTPYSSHICLYFPFVVLHYDCHTRAFWFRLHARISLTHTHTHYRFIRYTLVAGRCPFAPHFTWTATRHPTTIRGLLLTRYAHVPSRPPVAPRYLNHTALRVPHTVCLHNVRRCIYNYTFTHAPARFQLPDFTSYRILHLFTDVWFAVGRMRARLYTATVSRTLLHWYERTFTRLHPHHTGRVRFLHAVLVCVALPPSYHSPLHVPQVGAAFPFCWFAFGSPNILYVAVLRTKTPRIYSPRPHTISFCCAAPTRTTATLPHRHTCRLFLRLTFWFALRAFTFSGWATRDAATYAAPHALPHCRCPHIPHLYHCILHAAFYHTHPTLPHPAPPHTLHPHTRHPDLPLTALPYS